MPPPLSKQITDVLWGDPFQDAAAGAPQVIDGRTAALRILRRYLSEITFFRQGGKTASGEREPAIAFRIPEKDIQIEWPDEVDELDLPSIALLSQESGKYESLGMTPAAIVEDSKDQFGPGTVLNAQAELVETFVIEVWCKTRQERRGIRHGIESAMSPLQNVSGIRFRMPDYYDRLATYELQSAEIIDDEASTFARRKLRFEVLLRYVQVSLVKLPTFFPQPTTDVVVDSLEDEDDEPAPLAASDLP